MGFKPSEKVLAALRGVYNLPFNLDDPVFAVFRAAADMNHSLSHNITID